MSLELYPDHIEWTDTGLQIDRIQDLESRDMRPEVKDCKIVPSSSNNGAYLVAKVECLDKPFEEADITADKTELVVCSCPSFYFQKSSGLEADTAPSEVSTCKHGRGAYKHINAAQDDAQDTL